jgi:hypothetical protein
MLDKQESNMGIEPFPLWAQQKHISVLSIAHYYIWCYKKKKKSKTTII